MQPLYRRNAVESNPTGYLAVVVIHARKSRPRTDNVQEVVHFRATVLEMLVQELLNLLPLDPGSAGFAVAIIGSLIGAIVWLLGARFSRTIITLVTVLLGAAVGMRLPQWCGWSVSGEGTAVGGALGLGVTGYAMHRMWVGFGLGTVLCAWATMACWIGFRNGAAWTWPAWGTDTTIESYAVSLWQALPPDVARILPYACAMAMISGLAMAIIWPKTTLILAWSLIGATLLVSMGVAAVEYGQPQWLLKIPSPTWAQATLLGAIVSVGALVQWKLGPKPAAKSPKKKSDD
jgi:hypothetical protein